MVRCPTVTSFSKTIETCPGMLVFLVELAATLFVLFLTFLVISINLSNSYFFYKKKSSKRWISITLALISKKKFKKKHYTGLQHYISRPNLIVHKVSQGLLPTLQLWGLVWAHLIKMVSNLWTKQLQLGPNKAGPYYHMAAVHWPDDYRTRGKTSVRTPRVNYQLV